MRNKVIFDSKISYQKMPLIERKVQNKSSWRDHFKINKKLLPLKFTLFFFSASAFSILPYLTIHMKDIGIKVEHIALMYAILPFTIFFGKNNSAQIKKFSRKKNCRWDAGRRDSNTQYRFIRNASEILSNFKKILSKRIWICCSYCYYKENSSTYESI